MTTKLRNSQLEYDIQVDGADIDTTTLPEAGVGTKGMIELASNTDANNGTDETKAVTSKQVKDNYGISTTSTGFTHNVPEDSNTVDTVVSHTLGKVPQTITFAGGGYYERGYQLYSTGTGGIGARIYGSLVTIINVNDSSYTVRTTVGDSSNSTSISMSGIMSG